MTYREITPEDMPGIFDVRIRTWHNPHGAAELANMGITHDSVRALMKTTHRGWLAESEGDIIGFAMGNRESGEMWVIAVLKEFENQGIGKRLIARVENWLVAEGCEELWLTTDPDENYRAVGFYRHLGWKDWKFEDGDRFMKKNREEVPGPESPSA